MEPEDYGSPTPKASHRGGVAAELLAKHSRSQQPESQQLCLILHAVLEVLRGEGMEATPTALFAAIMSSLEKPETQASAQARLLCCTYEESQLSFQGCSEGRKGILLTQMCLDRAMTVQSMLCMSVIMSQAPLTSMQVCAAMCTILGAVLARAPNAVLRAKFGPSAAILSALAERHADQARSLPGRGSTVTIRRSHPSMQSSLPSGVTILMAAAALPVPRSSWTHALHCDICRECATAGDGSAFVLSQ